LPARNYKALNLPRRIDLSEKFEKRSENRLGAARKTRVTEQRGLVTVSVGRLKATEPTGRGSPRHDADASQVCILCVGQSRRDVHTPNGGLSHVRICR
jgi:hypothetical protein